MKFCCKAIKDAYEEFDYPFDVIDTVEINLIGNPGTSMEGQTGMIILRLFNIVHEPYLGKTISEDNTETWTKILFCPFCGQRINEPI